MRERLFPRWGAALFALLPLSELLYLPADGQTVYAAALASLVCALLCAGGAALAPVVRQYRVPQWALALFALWPLSRAVARMTQFVHRTALPSRPLWLLAALLTGSVLTLAAVGLNRLAMWALPIAWCTGAVLCLNGLLTVHDLTPAYWQAPNAALLPQTGALLHQMLPGALALSLSLPDKLSGAATRGFSAGGALLALLCLRTTLLLGEHTAALLLYPNFSAAGLAAIGDFARHGETLFAVPLLLCELGRAAALACVALLPVSQSYGVFRLRRPG